jgi:hypothetical protein
VHDIHEQKDLASHALPPASRKKKRQDVLPLLQ